MFSLFTFLATLLSMLLLLVRYLLTLPALSARPLPRRRGTPTRLLIVLGSGGHTAEMLHMLRGLDTFSYQHRSYVINSGDNLSAEKAIEFELYLEEKARRAANDVVKRPAFYGSYDLTFVPRARQIHQSLLKTPWSAFLTFLSCLAVLRGRYLSLSSRNDGNPENFAVFPSALHSNLEYPDLIIANGPATATILIFTSYILRFLSMPGTSGKMRSIYVESWARVQRLSLSGKLLSLFGMCERIVVQWEELAAEARGWNWGRQEFIGALVR